MFNRQPVGEIRVVSYEEAEEDLLRVAREYAEAKGTPWERMEKILAMLKRGVEKGIYQVGLDEANHPFVKELPQTVRLWG